MSNRQRPKRYIPGHYFIKDVSFHNGVVYPNVQVEVFRTDVYPYENNIDPIVVGVFGGAGEGYKLNFEGEIEKKVIELGKFIGQYRDEKNRRMVLLTGLCPGMPHLAAKGVREVNGFIVGITAADSYKNHIELLRSTLTNENVDDFIKEQEYLYNIAIFPSYELPKEVIKLTSLASQNLERLKAELDAYNKASEYLYSAVPKDELRSKLDEVKKKYEDRIRNLQTLSKLPSDYGKNMLKWRNPLNTELCDISIFIDGSAGTLCEFGMAYHPDHAIIGLLSENANSDFKQHFIKLYQEEKLSTPDILKVFHEFIGKKKNENQKVFYSNNVIGMMNALVSEWEKREESLMKSQKLLSEGLPKIFDLNTSDKNSDKIWEELADLKEIKYFPSIEKPLRRKIIEPLEEEIMKWELTK